jgi:hypothetical protein
MHALKQLRIAQIAEMQLQFEVYRNACEHLDITSALLNTLLTNIVDYPTRNTFEFPALAALSPAC